eukprot:s1454_g13.t1
MAERIEKCLWLKVKGGARAIEINATGIRNVDALLETVEDKVKPKLGSVGSSDLQLFQSEEAKDGGSEALPPNLGVAGITGGDIMENPLYVFPEVATASQAPATICGQDLQAFIQSVFKEELQAMEMMLDSRLQVMEGSLARVKDISELSAQLLFKIGEAEGQRQFRSM